MQQVRYVITPLALGALVLGGAANRFGLIRVKRFPHSAAGRGRSRGHRAYTVGEPQPSTDQVNGPVQGQLYAVETTATAVQGMAVPEIPMFNARADSGQNYRVLFQAAAPPGLARSADAGSADQRQAVLRCHGPAPTEIVYRDDVTQNNLVWGS